MSKVKMGSNPFVYPMPASIVGSSVDGKPNFMTIAYCGVINAGPTMVAIGSNPAHFTNRGIDANGTFSINIPNEALAKKTDFVGIYSGNNIDKSKVFDVFYGKLGDAPMIKECPVNLECSVLKVLSIGGKDTVYIGEVVETYCDEAFMTNGVPDISKIRPLLYATGTKEYWGIGEKVGNAWEIGKSSGRD